jgi:hypothetical protein
MRTVGLFRAGLRCGYPLESFSCKFYYAIRITVIQRDHFATANLEELESRPILFYRLDQVL